MSPAHRICNVLPKRETRDETTTRQYLLTLKLSAPRSASRCDRSVPASRAVLDPSPTLARAHALTHSHSPPRSHYSDVFPTSVGKLGAPRKLRAKKGPPKRAGRQGPKPLGLLIQNCFLETIQAVDAEVEDFRCEVGQPQKPGLSHWLIG